MSSGESECVLRAIESNKPLSHSPLHGMSSGESECVLNAIDYRIQ